ncbi:RagB/SusD family nutrient uptake outer membrane protein [Leptobacterium flavescens]|uniref:RagB/SusD family nutrient uptake outer membrane protein n=1 Tax=Leptobacterium flavescens TaxID=472055 RepID=A0A6P0UUZ7_9FLAO|nr:RagB/SusD family nutrient uptake outer membrane protein [Leptobacterium flavescens]NER14643.1 RagB/SusD family nutrient uptake outer membrane protein [Leptobacterium flavescens]
MKRKLLIKIGFPVLLSGLLVVSCTDLEIEATDSIITDQAQGIFNGVENVEASLNNLYNDIYGQLGDQANFFALNEVSTDETLVPTRGTDWGDNGIWRTLHAHTWSPTHQYILNTWNNLNQNVFRATEIIDDRSSPSAQEKAEAQFLRAFSMFFVMDMWGQAPFREADEGADVNPTVFSASEAYDFILQDLTEAIPNLPVTGPSADTDRASRAAGNFLMAKLRLNAHRYKGTDTPDSADLQAVIDAVDAIEADGFALQAGYFDLFTESVDNETIWFARTSVGNRIWNGMHYNQVSPDNTGGGWNGFTTLAEFYDTFEGAPNSNYVGDGQEERRGWVPDATNADATNLGIGYGFLINQQYNVNGDPLNDRPGDPLIFTKELPGLSGNSERTGVRIIKYHPVNGAFASHEIVFRFADAHLMKAEAMMRMGGDATGMVNTLRALRNASALGSVNETNLLEERGRELYYEFWRRNDMLRFGQFTRAWEFKDPASVGDSTRELYPIPPNALLSNPNLVQNPGY